MPDVSDCNRHTNWFGNNSTGDVTASTNWASSDSGFATINNSVIVLGGKSALRKVDSHN